MLLVQLQTGGVLTVENEQNSDDVNHGTLNILNNMTYAVGNDASIMFSAKDDAQFINPLASIGMKVEGHVQGGLVFNTIDQNDYTERMRIDKLGNVGIGTPSPTQKLDFSGDDPTKRS